MNKALLLLACLSAAVCLRADEVTGIVVTDFDALSGPTTTVFTTPDYIFDVRTAANAFYLDAQRLSYLRDGPDYFVETEFAAANYAPLMPGTYFNVSELGYLNGTPWMTFLYDSTGTENFNAQFTVLEAVYDANDVIQHFGAVFEIFQADGSPWWTGATFYNYDVPSAVPEPSSTSLIVLAAMLGIGIVRHDLFWGKRRKHQVLRTV